MIDNLLAKIEEQSRRSNATVRQMLIDTGKTEELAEFDRSGWDITTGVSRARAIWRSLSEIQRRVLSTLANDGRFIVRSNNFRRFFDIYKHDEPKMMFHVCNIATLRSLAKRGLIEFTGNSDDREGRAVITDRGRFVAKYGSKPKRPGIFCV